MWQLAEDLNERVAEYARSGSEDAVLSDDAVTLAQRVLLTSGQALPNGPAGLEECGLSAVARLFLCRFHAAHRPDYPEIMDVLRLSWLAAGEESFARLLDYTRECLLQRSWQRIGAAALAVLASDECAWEMDLLEAVDAWLRAAGELSGADAAAPYCLARQRWLRFLGMGLDTGDGELIRALAGFEDVYMPGSTVVPPLVREYLDCLHGQLIGGDARPGSEAAELFIVPRDDEEREAGRNVLKARLALTRSGRAESEHWLCSALMVRGMAARRLADLDEAVDRGWRLWDRVHVAPGKLRAEVGSTLQQALWMRSMMTGQNDDLENALNVGAVAVQGMPPESWETWGVIQSVAAALSMLAERRKELGSVDQAIRLAGSVAMATKESHLDPAKREIQDKDLYIESIYFMSSLYKLRYDLSGNPEDLDQAVKHGTYANERQKQGASEWVNHTFEVAKVYFARYQVGGSRTDLDNAITLVRSVLWHHGDFHSTGRALRDERRKLGEWLVARFQELGHDRDREEAVELLTGLAEEVGDDPRFPSRALLLANAAAAAAGSRLTEQQARRAVGWARQAVELSAVDSGEARFAHFALGRALTRLHDHDIAPALLDEAIDHVRQALASDTDGLRAAAAHELGRMLIQRYGADDPAVLSALELAVSVARGRLGHEARLLLAATLIDRARRGIGDPDQRRRGMALLERVALAPDTDDGNRTKAALGWASEAVASQEYTSAARAYRAAIDALPSPLWWASWIHERRERIQELNGVARAAAACAMRAGMAEHALESLERGRAMLWNQAMQMRAATERVTAADPRLGEQFSEILKLQENLTGAASPQTFTEYMAAVLVTLEMHNLTGVHFKDAPLAVAKRWQDLVDRAREMPGLNDLMRPSSAAALLSAVTAVPAAAPSRQHRSTRAAVLINMDQIGSHALIVTAGDLDVVDLPELVPERVVEVVRQFWQAIHTLDLGVFDLASRRQVKATITETRQWLWTAIAAPVLDRLGLQGPPRPGQAWPRVWWCPTGVVSMLPLHAAGEDGGGDCVIDRVISSYTVTLSTLLLARARPEPGLRPVLAVGGGEIRGAPRLPGVAEELADLEARFPGKVTRLDGAGANVGAVIEGIRRHPWVHLACHASPGFGDRPPSLHLDDGPLRIERLGWRSSGEAELAFLSACSTAETAVDMIDEAHHLAGALQVVGFRHVVGTLWGADDRVGIRVSHEFYDGLHQLSPGCADAAAEALHHAVRAVREDGHSAYLWAPYVHYGL